jgi:hypothetical protein
MFRENLENRIVLTVTLKPNDEIEEQVQKFAIDIQQSAWEAMPLITEKSQGK